jgi:hypothetical protein
MNDVYLPSLDSVEAGAPANEIEITSEMIEAGVRVLWESGAVEHPSSDADHNLIREIFLAMDQARP